MKHPDSSFLRSSSPALLVLAFLLSMTGCSAPKGEAPAAQMDPDFEPNEPHPFAERIETASGSKLTASDMTLTGDSVGSLVIERTDAGAEPDLLLSFSFHDDEGNSGAVKCEYNGFNELTDLWIESPQQRTHNTMQWDENGNLVFINQETWSQETTSDPAPSHILQVLEYRYSTSSGYGNWYAGMAEQLGGPVAPLFHAGLLGRAPWMLPESFTIVTSTILGDVIGEQKTAACHPAYEFDNNGRVISEQLVLPQSTHSYRYTYY